MTPADAWAVEDQTLCSVCGREACEDETHVARAGPMNGSGAPDDAEARAARFAIHVGHELERERARREARRLLDAEARGSNTPPEIITLAQLLAEPEPAVRWRIEGWQPAESRVILAAPRKAGKTTLMGSLIRALVDGDQWLGRYDVQPVAGTVALIDTEMSRGQLRRWFRDQAIARTDRVRIVPLRGRATTLDLLDPACRAQWAEWLQAETVRYLIVDCLRPVLDALGLEESREAGRWLVGFDALLKEAEIPDAVIVHHMGHTGERSRGDSRLRDWPDVEWRVVRQDEDDASPRFIAAYGRDVQIAESQLAYDPLTRRLTLVGGSRHDARTEAALEGVIEVLGAATGPLTGRRIKDALADSDHGRNTIDAALRLGSRDGRLAAENGPRRSRLYSVPVSRGVPAVSRVHSPERVSECPAASIEADTQDTPALPLGTVEMAVSDQDTQRHSRRGRARADGSRNTPRTRRHAEEESLGAPSGKKAEILAILRKGRV